MISQRKAPYVLRTTKYAQTTGRNNRYRHTPEIKSGIQEASAGQIQRGGGSTGFVHRAIFAEAVELLNIKLNALKQLQEELPYHRGPRIKKVNISACGMSFEDRDKIDIGKKLYLDITLIPSDLHVFTLAEVVDSQASSDNLEGWTVRVDFYGMAPEDEELMVQHIVKRQGRLLSAQRR